MSDPLNQPDDGQHIGPHALDAGQPATHPAPTGDVPSGVDDHSHGGLILTPDGSAAPGSAAGIITPADVADPVGPEGPTPTLTPQPLLHTVHGMPDDGLYQIRHAVPADLTYIDSLQKTHGHEVGFMAKAWLAKCLEKDMVTLATENGEPAAYLLGKPSYKGRQDVGIVYQACVQYDAQRRALGTALVEQHLARFPPTTKSVVLWCAQDLDANLFWQAMGFQPIAYRAGSRRKGRVHIYWARPVRHEPGVTLWHPESTHGGPMREHRDVIPITARDNWTAAKQLVLPDPPPNAAGEDKSDGNPRRQSPKQRQLEQQRAAFRGQPGQPTHWIGASGKKPLDLAKVRERTGSMPD